MGMPMDGAVERLAMARQESIRLRAQVEQLAAELAVAHASLDAERRRRVFLEAEIDQLFEHLYAQAAEDAIDDAVNGRR